MSPALSRAGLAELNEVACPRRLAMADAGLLLGSFPPRDGPTRAPLALWSALRRTATEPSAGILQGLVSMVDDLHRFAQMMGASADGVCPLPR